MLQDHLLPGMPLCSAGEEFQPAGLGMWGGGMRETAAEVRGQLQGDTQLDFVTPASSGAPTRTWGLSPRAAWGPLLQGTQRS